MFSLRFPQYKIMACVGLHHTHECRGDGAMSSGQKEQANFVGGQVNNSYVGTYNPR